MPSFCHIPKSHSLRLGLSDSKEFPLPGRATVYNMRSHLFQKLSQSICIDRIKGSGQNSKKVISEESQKVKQLKLSDYHMVFVMKNIYTHPNQYVHKTIVE